MKPTPTIADLVSQFRDEVWRYLRYLGADDAEAEDLTQETFLAIWEKPFEYLGPREAGAYLRTVARRKLLMARRKTKRRPPEFDLDLAEQVWAESVGDSSDDFLDALRDCVEKLQGRAEQAIELHYREQSSRTAIADQLGMTPDGVKTLLRRTRDALRECIQRNVPHDE